MYGTASKPVPVRKEIAMDKKETFIVIVRNKENPTLVQEYPQVYSITTQTFEETGLLWQLNLECRPASSDIPPVTATFPDREWHVFVQQ